MGGSRDPRGAEPAELIATDQIFLSAADQIIVASSYGKIGTDLKDLGRVSWLATS